MKPVLAMTFLLGASLAGCAGDEPPPTPAATGAPGPIEKDATKLADGRGAIAGLLIDDRFRPIAGGIVLLQELGRTTQSNADGEFAFLDLPPANYTLKAGVEGHEARTESVLVTAGQFAEARLVARRLVNEAGTILTQEYSVFIPCAADYVVNGGNLPCTLELSGDGYGSAFTSNLTAIQNVTYVVTEMKANQDNRFEVQIRATGANGTERYAVAQLEGSYVKIVNKIGERNLEHEVAKSYGENSPFNVSNVLNTLLFVDHEGREEIQGVWPQNPGAPTWITPCCGVGLSAGIKAKFVQSIFIGPPEVDIATYRVYA